MFSTKVHGKIIMLHLKKISELFFKIIKINCVALIAIKRWDDFIFRYLIQ